MSEKFNRILDKDNDNEGDQDIYIIKQLLTIENY